MQTEGMVKIVLYNKDTNKVVARWDIREENGKVFLEKDGEKAEQLEDGRYKLKFYKVGDMDL